MKRSKISSAVLLLAGACLTIAADPPPGYWVNDTALLTPNKQVCVAVVSGKIYVIGGPPCLPAINNRCDEYDPTTQTWTQKAAMPTGRGQAACAVVGTKVYVFGGNNSCSNNWLSTNECYDTSTNTWTTGLAPLPGTPRGDLSAVTVGGLIYVMGGNNSYVGEFNYNHIYNPQTNSWSTGAPLPADRGSHGAAVLDGKIYLVGGHNRVNGPITEIPEVHVYDPAQNTWSEVAPLNVPRAKIAVVSMYGRIYAIGGWLWTDPRTYFDVVEEYDPRDNYWRKVTHLPEPRAEIAAAVLGGEIYLIGGDTGHPPYDRVYAGIPRPAHGDMNNDGETNILDINPFILAITMFGAL